MVGREPRRLKVAMVGKKILLRGGSLFAVMYILILVGFHSHISTLWDFQQPFPQEKNRQQLLLDPTNPKVAVHRALDEFITEGGVLYRPGLHYNCTNENGKTITLPRLPTFLIIGAQKGGTSALNALLSKHRRIIKPAYFEPHFFDQHPAVASAKKRAKIHAEAGKEKLKLPDNMMLTSGIKTYETPPLICSVREAYASSCFYKHKVARFPAMLTYEKTPAYILVEGGPLTIKTVAPWAKIIVSLRHPVDRAFSNFKMQTSRSRHPGILNKTFEDVLAKDLVMLRHHNFHVPDDEPFPKMDPMELDDKQLNNPRWKYASYLYRSMYADQLRPWLEQYRLGENLMVVNYERLNKYPEIVLQEILEFLQIPDHSYRYKEMVKSYSPNFFRTNQQASQNLTLRAETRDYLTKLFEPYNQDLVDLLGKEWKDIWKETRY